MPNHTHKFQTPWFCGASHSSLSGLFLVAGLSVGIRSYLYSHNNRTEVRETHQVIMTNDPLSLLGDIRLVIASDSSLFHRVVLRIKHGGRRTMYITLSVCVLYKQIFHA